MPDKLNLGKLPPELLRRQLAKIPISDHRIVVPPQVGEDCTVIRIGGKCIVVTTDPITFTTDKIGWYGVHVNANDVAVMGARPAQFFATVLLPPGADERQVDAIFDDIIKACGTVGATLSGGHIEVTAAVGQIVLNGTMIGEANCQKLVTKNRIRPGDDIILTKWAGLEGTAIIAADKRAELSGVLSASELDAAANLLYEPGISIVADALAACDAVDAEAIHGMHDPTEGGVATALHELAEAASRQETRGLVVDFDKIPVRSDTRAICEHYDIDPLGLLSSGALLIAADPDSTPEIIGALSHRHIHAARIGQFTDAPERLLCKNGSRLPLPRYNCDEISKALSDTC